RWVLQDTSKLPQRLFWSFRPTRKHFGNPMEF
ncbi:MAG: hypothetical protein ACI9R3_002865, partial [Verrucomicrobiales bacterium]